MKTKLCFAMLLLAVLAGFQMPAQAQSSQPRLVGTYKSWSSYVFNEDGKEVCYMAARPDGEHGDYTKRGEIFALITHRPSEGARNVFSYIAGYPYKPGSDATIDIDGEKFILFTQDETAWSPDGETDTRLAEAIKKGKKMVVKGTSARGTSTTDTFSLGGSGDAHDKITDACY